MFITETLLPHQIALELTDQRGKRIYKNVEVHFLLPTKPQLDQPAIVIDGPDMGEVGIVQSKNRKTKDYKIELNPAAIIYLPEDKLCRVIAAVE
jgi:hypothetical protein